MLKIISKFWHNVKLDNLNPSYNTRSIDNYQIISSLVFYCFTMVHLGVYLLFTYLHWNLIQLPESENSHFICIGKMSTMTSSYIISSKLSQLTLCEIPIRCILGILSLFFFLVSRLHFPTNCLFSILVDFFSSILQYANSLINYHFKLLLCYM